MKRILLRLFVSLALSAVSVVGAVAQNVFEGVISFDKVEHNFGDILISSGPKECTFTFKNVGKGPIAVYRVLSSCGCTEPTWTQKPLKSGESGEIKVVFNNDQGPYPFNKTLTVYASGVSKPILLRIKGVAHDKKKSISELYPVHYGPVGVKESKLSFGQMEQGSVRSIEVELANITNKSVSVSFSEMTPGLSLSANKLDIAPNSIVKVICTINTAKTSSKKWGKTPFSFTLKAGDKSYRNFITIEPLIKENFNDLSEQQKRYAAFPQFEASSLDFGVVKAGEKLKGEFVVKNIGRDVLKFYKADVSEFGAKLSLPGDVGPAATGKIVVDIDTAGQSGEILNIVTLITNSPTRPIINLFIIYTVN